MIDKAVANGKPDLNILFIYNITFRGMGKLMGGMITMDMADDIRFIANGHFFKGVGRLVKHFMYKPKLIDVEYRRK
jgi:beta-glucosidase